MSRGQNLGHRLVLKRTDHQISLFILEFYLNFWSFVSVQNLVVRRTEMLSECQGQIFGHRMSFTVHLSWHQVLLSGVSSFFFIGDTSHRTVVRGSKLGAETWTSSHSRSTFIKSQRACSAFISLPGQDPKLQWAVHLCLSKSLSGTLSIHFIYILLHVTKANDLTSCQ